jgi:hypothetical protein
MFMVSFESLLLNRYIITGTSRFRKTCLNSKHFFQYTGTGNFLMADTVLYLTELLKIYFRRQAVTNSANTFYATKRLIGRR